MSEGICDFRFAICDLGAGRRTARAGRLARQLGCVTASRFGPFPIADRKSKIPPPVPPRASLSSPFGASGRAWRCGAGHNHKAQSGNILGMLFVKRQQFEFAPDCLSREPEVHRANRVDQEAHGLRSSRSVSCRDSRDLTESSAFASAQPALSPSAACRSSKTPIAVRGCGSGRMLAMGRPPRVTTTSSPRDSTAAQVLGKLRDKAPYESTFIKANVAARGRRVKPLRKQICDFRFAICDLRPNPGLMPGSCSRRKATVEIGVVTDPDPQPMISVSPSHGSIVLGHAHGQRAGVAPEPLQVQTWMTRVSSKPVVRGPSLFANLRRQGSIEPPETGGAVRTHEWRSNSASEVSGQEAGSRSNSARASASSVLSAGRGRGSWIMRSHAASPSNSGNSSGIDAANSRRSSAESVRMASRIACTVLTKIEYGSGGALTSLHHREWKRRRQAHLRGPRRQAGPPPRPVRAAQRPRPIVSRKSKATNPMIP